MTNQPAFPYLDPAVAASDRAADLLARMTLAEKLAQLGAVWLLEVGDESGFLPEKAQAAIGVGIGQITRPSGSVAFLPAQVARDTAAIQTFLREQTRLGIPAMVHDECCAGFMARGATVFPQAIGLASTWRPELVEAMTRVIRSQMLAVGSHQGLAPVLDVTRDPRWGRVEETFGEDPYLVASMGTAYVRGLQGPDLAQGIAATGKHFAAHGMPEGGLNWAPVHVGRREMREVFLLPFEAAVKEAGLATMMNAYHELDGVPCGASRELLTDILRVEWGFQGIVVSDYNTLPMLVDYHHVAADKAEAARLGLAAGLDIELPGANCYGAPLLEAIESGRIDVALVDAAVRRILDMKFRLGLFERPAPEPERAPDAFGRPEQADLALRLAQQSLVMLKNDQQMLPLRPNLGSLAVIGPNADSIRNMVGDYSYASMTDLMEGGHKSPEETRFPDKLPPMPTILQAIRERAGAGIEVRYAAGCGYMDHSRAGFADAVQMARQSDVVVMVMGGRSGLGQDCTCGECRDRAGLGLPGVQEELVQAVLNTGAPVVLVLVDGRPAAVPALAEQVPAILQAWLPGQAGGPAVAQALFGDINPGGKLPITIPRSAGQIPVYYGHKPSGGRSYPFNDYVDLSAQPLYAFGHGLSYTQFEYANLRVSPPQVSGSGEVTISVNVTNAGQRAGDEVVQLYVRDVVASLTRPVMELKGFQRLTLQPAQTATVSFVIAAAQLAFYDHDMRFTVEPGAFEVMVGGASDDIRLTGQFEVTGPAVAVTRKVFFTTTTTGEVQ